MAFSTVDYDDGVGSTFRGIEVSYKENGVEMTKRFDTGDPIIDYYDYQKWLHEAPKEFWAENWKIGGSSSWDHFLMDNKTIQESYFEPKTGEFLNWRKALKENDIDKFEYITEKCPSIWHNSSMKNFNDVKNYYKSKQT